MPKRSRKNKNNKRPKSRVPRPLAPGHLIMHSKESSGVGMTTTSAAGLFELTQIALNVRSTNIGVLYHDVGLLYEKWRILKLTALLKSWLPTTTGGASAISFLPDPFATVTTFEGVIASQNSKETRPWDEINFRVPFSRAWFYCALQNAEQRLSDNGSVVHATQQFTSAVTPGNIVFDATIEFSGPLA